MQARGPDDEAGGTHPFWKSWACATFLSSSVKVCISTCMQGMRINGYIGTHKLIVMYICMYIHIYMICMVHMYFNMHADIHTYAIVSSGVHHTYLPAVLFVDSLTHCLVHFMRQLLILAL